MPFIRTAACVATVLCCVVTPATSADDPPNFLVLIADDAGWQDSGIYGNSRIKTPNIDRLAKTGLLFERAFLTTAQCSPSRISILTGRYPHATGAEDLHTPLPEGQTFVTTHLAASGYATGAMKKTHFGPNGERQFGWYSEETIEAFPDFLEHADDRPWFLWVGFSDPHRPYDDAPKVHDPSEVLVPPQLADTPETRADLAGYYDEITRMDGVIGSFIAELERRGLRDDTIVIFFSDNGMPFPRAKATVYDAGVRTPFIVSRPGVLPERERSQAMVSLVDLAPTVLDIAGLHVAPEMQGESMKNVWTDPQAPGRRFVFSERNWHNCDEHIRSLRTEEYRLIVTAYAHLPFGTPADISKSPSWYALKERQRAGALTRQQARLFEVPRPRVELYDLTADPGEFVNVADRPKYGEIAIELLPVLGEWQRRTGDFSPLDRRRPDNTDRITGVKFGPQLPPRIENRGSQEIP